MWSPTLFAMLVLMLQSQIPRTSANDIFFNCQLYETKITDFKQHGLDVTKATLLKMLGDLAFEYQNRLAASKQKYTTQLNRAKVDLFHSLPPANPQPTSTQPTIIDKLNFRQKCQLPQNRMACFTVAIQQVDDLAGIGLSETTQLLAPYSRKFNEYHTQMERDGMTGLADDFVKDFKSACKIVGTKLLIRLADLDERMQSVLEVLSPTYPRRFDLKLNKLNLSEKLDKVLDLRASGLSQRETFDQGIDALVTLFEMQLRDFLDLIGSLQTQFNAHYDRVSYADETTMGRKFLENCYGLLQAKFRYDLNHNTGMGGFRDRTVAEVRLSMNGIAFSIKKFFKILEDIYQREFDVLANLTNETRDLMHLVLYGMRQMAVRT